MIYTLNFTIPPATDVEDLIGTYGSLLTAHNIKNTLGETSGNFSHPIPESVQVILSELEANQQLMASIQADCDSAEVTNVVMNNLAGTITIRTDSRH